MATGRLILAPRDPYLLLGQAPLLAALQGLKLTGAPLPNRSLAYSAGDAFMQWISFAGCSPFLRFEPESSEDDAFCHIRLTLVMGNQPLFLGGNNSKPPVCSHCKHTLTEWRQLMQQWQEDQPTPACSKCGTRIEPAGLNWRRHAGLGRTLVEIFNVFPAEAVPVPALFDRLLQHTGCSWHYFYVQ